MKKEQQSYDNMKDLLLLLYQLQTKAGNLTEEERKRLDMIDKKIEELVIRQKRGY